MNTLFVALLRQHQQPRDADAWLRAPTCGVPARPVLMLPEHDLVGVECDDERLEAALERGTQPRILSWRRLPLLQRFVELTLRSRGAATVLGVWRDALLEDERAKLTSTRKAAAQRLATDRAATTLLARTKSAIYQRWVWAHLVAVRQDLLDEFLNSGATFRGAFFVPPSRRKFIKVSLAASKNHFFF